MSLNLSLTGSSVSRVEVRAYDEAATQANRTIPLQPIFCVLKRVARKIAKMKA
jgi:hypothetical protein